eukprot:gnl/MRDRNA2_/MRDRNA2_110949_c0_seq1.p1 gnl/MRDRNA2_/MRDRNA2_110949_c0~~gnl/MRDRNA2_/MRDRNA2_110949_c0_seq1.p1  ORF type:complete len:829 (+),score=167.97 gnl/MRDRNA2_/MRDRNA2_110949_c0_seq1:187-2487(+)
MAPQDAALASDHQDWRERRSHLWDLGHLPEAQVRLLCLSIREVLEMKGMAYKGRMRRSSRLTFRKLHPGESMPLAPLRAISYASAGGSFSTIVGDQPLSALMKIGYEKGSGNVFTNKVVLLDEAHNLVRAQTQFAGQLTHLRDLLVSAKNLVLAGFTGTPIVSEPSEGRRLLDIVKGPGGGASDEGFISSFSMRPRALFPVSLPRGIPDCILTIQKRHELVKKVNLFGDSLKVYDLKRQMGHGGQRLRNYCNVCTFYTSFHDGKNGSKSRVLSSPEECCPKFLAVAEAVAGSSQKAVVLTGRSSGHVVMLELLRQIAARSTPPFHVATMNELSEFNHVSNLRGEKYRVLVADAAQCSEGCSFLAVRRTFLTDVPSSHSQFVQQCGRAIRMYGHRGLAEEEQTVTTQLFVATLPKWMRSQLECWAFRAQSKNCSGQEVEKRARLLAARLQKVGIDTLDELKNRIDAHGAAAQDLKTDQTGKVKLTSDDVHAFLEQNGLWEEAKLLIHAAKREREIANKVSTQSSDHSEAQPTKARERPLQQAIQALYLAGSLDDASLALRVETADEEAVKDLANQAEELTPALAALRDAAIDRGIFKPQHQDDAEEYQDNMVVEDNTLAFLDEDPEMKDSMISSNPSEASPSLECHEQATLVEVDTTVVEHHVPSETVVSTRATEANTSPKKRPHHEVAAVPERRVRFKGKSAPCKRNADEIQEETAKSDELAMQVEAIDGGVKPAWPSTSAQSPVTQLAAVRRRMRGKGKPQFVGV